MAAAARRAGRAGAHYREVEGGLVIERGGRAAVKLRDDLLEAHASLAEKFAVQVDDGHRQDLPLFHLALKERTIDHRMANARVDHGHQVQRLNDVGAIPAAL